MSTFYAFSNSSCNLNGRNNDKNRPVQPYVKNLGQTDYKIVQYAEQSLFLVAQAAPSSPQATTTPAPTLICSVVHATPRIHIYLINKNRYLLYIVFI